MKKTKTKSFLQTVIIFLCTCLFFLTGCASNKIFYIETEDDNFYNHVLFKFKNYEVYIENNSEETVLKNIQLENFNPPTYLSTSIQQEGYDFIGLINAFTSLSSSNFNETTINQLEIIDKNDISSFSTSRSRAYSNKYNSYIYVRQNYTIKEEKKVQIKNKDERYEIIYYEATINSDATKYEWRTHTIEIPKEKLKAIYYYSK